MASLSLFGPKEPSLITPTLILNETVVPPEDGRIYGIHTATQEWLKAYVRHLQPREIFFRSQNMEQDRIIAELAAANATPITLKKSQSANDIPHCAVYIQLPDANHFWMRQWQSSRLYSICGLNHSLSGQHIYDQLRNIFLAPTEAWDALICSSRAAHNVISAHIENWSEYLASRSPSAKVDLRPPLRLPIIPMGANTAFWAKKDSTVALGQKLRAQLNIGPNDVAVLFLGRLNFSSKAHPFPMLQALQEAQTLSGTKLHLLQAGWYPSPEIEDAMRALTAELAPGIQIHKLAATNDTERLSAYAAADIFVSLADNIQESFGLTLVEAMACGLPVVASDWDGYRDTITNGETGFLIPTLIAPPESGADIGLAHGLGTRTYNRYLMDVAQATAVSVNAARDALIKLITDRDLRQRMGEAGRKRASEQFDWGVIVKAHQDLWEELEICRRAAPPSVPTKRNPNHPDPFTLFQNFATSGLQLDTPLSLTTGWNAYLGASMRSLTMRTRQDWVANDASLTTMLRYLQTRPGLTVASLMDLAKVDYVIGLRSIMWLIKASVIQPGLNGF
jgi:glycosyltransferase involved in cell wall biosynthesis